MVAAAESTTESLFSVHAAGGPTCTTLAVHKREKLEKGPKAVPASRAKVSPAQPQTPVRSASVPPENSGSRNTPEAADSPPFTPPRGFVSAVQISEQTCKIAPSIGEWAAQQNGRQDKLLRRHLTRHAATSRQTVALQLDSDKQPTRRQRRKQRAAERAKQLRSQSADDVATLGGPPALPPLSFADTMRFGHDLSVAIATNKAEEAGGGKGSVSFQDALELDAAIEAADGEGQGGLLVDLLSLEVVSTAIGDAMFDIFGTRAEEEEEEEDATPTAVAATQQERQKKRNKLHINSTLGTTLGNQGHDRNGHPQDMPQPLGTCLFPPLRTSTAHLESNPEEKGVMAAACFNLATKHLKAVGSAAKPRSNIPSLLCRHRRAVWPIQVAPQAGGKPPPGSKLGGTAKWTGSAAASWPMTSTEAQRPNREGRKERRE